MREKYDAPRRMPIKVNPYEHQRKAFDFVMQTFGLEGGDDDISIKADKGAALLMEM